MGEWREEREVKEMGKWRCKRRGKGEEELGGG